MNLNNGKDEFEIMGNDSMTKTLKSCGFNKTSLDMSMILFDEVI